MILQPYEDSPAAADEAAAAAALSSAAYVEWHRRCGASRPEPEQTRRLVRPVPVAAGTIVAMAPYVWHCSDANRTGAFRRAYMPQYSAGAVLTASDGGVDHEGRAPLALVVPV